MLLVDVNLLVYAAIDGSPDHTAYRDWLAGVVSRPEPFGMSELALSAFMRITTNQRAFSEPLTPEAAIGFVEAIHQRPNCVSVLPGPRHWGLFVDLCRQVEARGNDVPDAYYAALAIEHDCEWVTADRGFAKFPGLRWRHPLDG